MSTEKPQSYLSKLGNLLTTDLANSFVQVSRGIIQLSAASGYGLAGTLVSIAAFSGISWFQHNRIEKQAKKNLLDLYSQEISAITNKPASELKISDLDIAANHNPDGKGNAIALELGAIDKNLKIHLVTNLISIVGIAALATVSAGLLPATMFSGASFAIPAAVFGGLSKIISMSADHVASGFNGGKEQYSFNIQLREMVKQGQLRKLEPEQVFSLLLKANPEIENEIKNKYTKDYNTLPLAIKSEIVGSYENRLNAKHLTEMINRAEMNVQELGFIAYGTSSGNIIKDTAKQTPTSIEYNDSDLGHVARLNKKRMEEMPSLTLH